MSSSAEASNQDSKPVELYEFRCGPNEPWRYCTGEVEHTWRGKVFTPIDIDNEGFTQSGNAEDDSIVVTVPDDLPMMGMLFSDPPTIPFKMIVRHRYGDSGTPPLIHVIAELRAYGRRDAKMAALTFQPVLASFKRSGARMAWQRQCPHALYDKNCRVNPLDFEFSFTVDSINHGKIRSSELETLNGGYLDNGYIEWTNAYNITQRRAIEHNRKDEITLYGVLSGISAGMVIKAYPGCQRTSRDCKMKFNNILNYGGIEKLAGKSPFQGDPIW